MRKYNRYIKENISFNCFQDDLKCIKNYIKRGGDVNQCITYTWDTKGTPLINILIADSDNALFTDIISSPKFNPNILDKNNKSILMTACEWQKPYIVSLLLDTNTININTLDNYGFNALMWLVPEPDLDYEDGFEKTLRLLIYKNINVNQKGNTGVDFFYLFLETYDKNLPNDINISNIYSILKNGNIKINETHFQILYKLAKKYTEDKYSDLLDLIKILKEDSPTTYESYLVNSKIIEYNI